MYTHMQCMNTASRCRNAISLFRLRDVKRAIRGAVHHREKHLVMSQIDKVIEWSIVGDRWKEKGLDPRQEVEEFVRLYHLAIDKSQTPSEARCEAAVMETLNDTSQLTTSVKDMSLDVKDISTALAQVAAAVLPCNNPDTSMGGAAKRSLDQTALSSAGEAGGHITGEALDWAFERGRQIGRAESNTEPDTLDAVDSVTIDARVLDLIRTIKGHSKTLDFGKTQEARVELEACLGAHADILTPDRRRQAFYALSELWTTLALRQAKNGQHPDFTNARKFLKEAKA